MLDPEITELDVPRISSRGVLLTSAPTEFHGADLKVAQNVVVMRDGNVQGLSKRGGLTPLEHSPFGAAINNFVPVPLTDAQTTSPRVIAPVVGSTTGDVAVIEKYQGTGKWTSMAAEAYTLHLMDTSTTRAYYAGNDSPPTLYTDNGEVKVPLVTPRRADGKALALITCVRAFSLPDEDLTPVVYFATQVEDSGSSLIDIWQLNANEGTVRLVEPSVGGATGLTGTFIVTDMVVFDGRLFVLAASTAANSKLFSIDADRSKSAEDEWKDEGTFGDDFVPLSATTGAGKIFIGCSNSRDTTNAVGSIFEFGHEGLGTTAVAAVSTVGVYSHFAALINHDDEIYAVEIVDPEGTGTERQSRVVQRQSGGSWSAVANISVVSGGTRNGSIWGAAKYSGGQASIGGLVYVVLPATGTGVVLCGSGSTWNRYSSRGGRSYRGVVGGILD